MTESERWKQIARQLAGAGTEEEKQEMLQWRHLHPDHEQQWKLASAIWQNSSLRHTMTSADTDEQWIAFVERVIREEEVKQSSWKNVITSPYTKIAASLIFLVVVISIFFIKPKNHSPIKDEVSDTRLTVITSGDSVQIITLPDGSRVWLNSHSTIRFDSIFEQRHLSLTGEAYFEVVRDTARQFQIEALHAIIRVLGTSFHVKTDSLSNEVEVNVVTGSVEFTQGDKTVILKASERARTQTDPARDIEKDFHDSQSFLAWRKQNNPVYEDERSHPERYLISSFTTKKNLLNQTVIECTIYNTATLANYQRIVVHLVYKNKKGKEVVREHLLHINQPLPPGKTATFRRSLLDIFRKDTPVKVEVRNAQIID